MRFQSNVAAASVAVPPGTILMYGGVNAPAGYLLCDGSAVSRSAYSGLFGVVGTAFGAGDGSTTFNLPNMIGVFPTGAPPGAAGATGTGTYHTHSLTSAVAAISMDSVAAKADSIRMLRVGAPPGGYTANIANGTALSWGPVSDPDTYGAALIGSTDNESPLSPPYIQLLFLIKT